MSEQNNKKNITEEMSRRSMLLWTLAGIYLLYTGYTLCANTIKGVDGGGIGFFIVGIVFLLIGGGLLFAAAKGYMKLDKKQKEQKAAEEAAAEKAEEENVEEIEAAAESAETPAPHKMSIAERAALANQAEDGEGEETE